MTVTTLPSALAPSGRGVCHSANCHPTLSIFASQLKLEPTAAVVLSLANTTFVLTFAHFFVTETVGVSGFTTVIWAVSLMLPSSSTVASKALAD